MIPRFCQNFISVEEYLKLTNTLTNISEESKFNLTQKSIPIYIKNVSKNKLAKEQSKNLRVVTNYPLIT